MHAISLVALFVLKRRSPPVSSTCRYKRYIVPILSCSIDFYIRLFVRVHTRPQVSWAGWQPPACISHMDCNKIETFLHPAAGGEARGLQALARLPMPRLRLDLLAGARKPRSLFSSSSRVCVSTANVCVCVSTHTHAHAHTRPHTRTRRSAQSLPRVLFKRA